MKNKILTIIIFIWLIWYVHSEELNLSKIYNTEYIPWEIIIKYSDTNTSSNQNLKSIRSLSTFNSELESNNLEIKNQLNNLWNIALVEIKDDKTVEEAINILNRNPNIEYAEPNYIRYFLSNDVNDTRKSEQRGLDYINWNEWYDQYSGFLANWTWVVIWVIDNWVNYNHPDLYYSMWNPENWKCKIKTWNNIEYVNCIHWYDFLHNTPTPLPNLSSHWTHVAGIIAATINNWKWIVWVNPHAKIAALKVWNWNTLTTYAEIQAIDFAIQNWIKIINASYWAYGSWNAEYQALKQYMDFGWLFITAAWNDYKKDIDNISRYSTYPCMYDFDNIICVTSINSSWNLSSFSNFWKTSVDIAAPWTAILSTSIEDSNISTWIYKNNFETDNWEWTWWKYYNRWNNTYAYGFTWELTSPSISLIWKNNVYISLSLACASHNVDVSLQYSTGENYLTSETIQWVYNMWYYYTIPIDNKYYTNNFSFKLETSTSNTFCVIDDLTIYQDPYYESDTERYTFMDWTSMATPHVAWLASLIRTLDPELTYTEVKNLILNNWKESPELTDLTVSWKIIDIKKTLESVTNKTDFENITWLQSSRTWNIKYDSLTGIHKYYFEVLSWDNIIKSGFIENDTTTWTNLTWNYTRRVLWIDKFWNTTDFSTGYICSVPTLTKDNLTWNFSWYECSNLSWTLNFTDNCSNFYEISQEDNTWNFILNWPWLLNKEIFIRNWFWEESNHLNANYTWTDSLPTIDKKSYTYPTTITSTSQQNIKDIVSLLWVKDWNCWVSTISIVSISCSNWYTTLNSNNITISIPWNQKWSETCEILFKDDEWNQLTWDFIYSFDTTTKPITNWWWGWGGWGGWTSKNNTNTTTWTKNLSWETKSITNTWSNITWTNQETMLEKPRMLELFENNKDNSHNYFDFSRFNNSNPSSISTNWYTVELNNAYEFAHRAWITTTDSIDSAKMNENLTRIAMAKMLSQYAINILWKTPKNMVNPSFPDVSNELNAQYNDGVNLAYKLWIMWKWINKFRPYDTVTRAEFTTALSRMLYETPDWSQNYYSTHINKLYKEWIITNTNPEIKEKRWYVMIMLMRSAKN